MARSNNEIQHVFIIGSKSIGQYGGYETFVDRLIGEHENNGLIKYHVACKANGDGYMDETKLNGVEVTKNFPDGSVSEFTYKKKTEKMSNDGNYHFSIKWQFFLHNFTFKE